MHMHPLAFFVINMTEAEHIARVLGAIPGINPTLQKLSDGLALGVETAPLDYEAEIALPFGVLEELARIFAKRRPSMDRRLGLDPDLGYSIAEALLLTFAKARRFAAFPTAAEVDEIEQLFAQAVPA